MCSSLSERIDGPVRSRRTRESSYGVLQKKTQNEAGRRQAAGGLRVCNSELGNVLARSWFRIRLRYIPTDKVSTMRAGQKGFPTATQNDCETPPTERSYSYPGLFSRG